MRYIKEPLRDAEKSNMADRDADDVRREGERDALDANMARTIKEGAVETMRAKSIGRAGTRVGRKRAMSHTIAAGD